MLTVVVRAGPAMLLRAVAQARWRAERSRAIEWLLIDSDAPLGSSEPFDDASSPTRLRRIGAAGALTAAEAIEVAWRAGTGEIVAFFCDAVPRDDACLDALVGVLADARVDVACGAFDDEPEEGGDAARPLIPGTCADAERRALVGARGALSGVALGGGAFAVRRTVLEACGGFCIWLGRLYYEELGVRLRSRGAHFAVAPRATVDRIVPAPDAVPAGEALGFLTRHPCADLLAWLAGAASLAEGGALRITRPDADAIRRAFGRASPIQPLFLPSEIVEYYVELSGVEPSRAAAYVDAAQSTELAIQGCDGTKRFDRYHVANWIDDQTLYKQCDLSENYGFRNPTPAQRNEGHVPLRLRYEGTYRIEIDAGALAPLGDGITLTIPVPVDIGPQRAVRLRAVEPPTLAAHLDTSAGLIRDVVVPKARDASAVVFEYSFTCEVEEVLAGRARHDDDAVSQRYLRPTLPPHQRERAEGLLRRIVPTRALPPREIARAIYLFLLDRVTYRQSNAGSGWILDTGIGTCFHLAWLFVNLCRIAGIPARERNGALIGRIAGDRVATMYSRGHSPLLHCWAEFVDPGAGWVPVEFLALCYSRRILTDTNVVDPALRERLLRMTGPYEAYYFGNLDPYRIHAAVEANRAPTFPLGCVVPTADALQRLLWGTRHRLTVSFEPERAA